MTTQEPILNRKEEQIFDEYWETNDLSRFGIDRSEFHGLVASSLSLQRQHILEAVEKEIDRTTDAKKIFIDVDRVIAIIKDI